jgi:transposase
MNIAAPLPVCAADRRRLARLVRADPEVATRAKIVVLASRGVPNTRIAQLLGVTRPTVTSWRARYASGGIAALETLPRAGRPPQIDESAIILATVRDQPPTGTRWSARSLGDHLGVSASTVAKVWRAWDLRPGRSGEVMLPTSPPLPSRLRDIVGLHLDPPCHALLVRRSTSAASVEVTSRKTLTMCAERALPVRPSPAPDASTELLTEIRHAIGRRADPCFPTSHSENLLLFLSDSIAAYPAEDLHVIVDEATARSADVRAWSRRHRRVHLHTPATPAPWTALFSITLRITTAHCRPELDQAVGEFIAGWRADSQHFSWLNARRADVIA